MHVEIVTDTQELGERALLNAFGPKMAGKVRATIGRDEHFYRLVLDTVSLAGASDIVLVAHGVRWSAG